MANMTTRRYGPPPKPAEQKRRNGNPGKQKLPKEGNLTILKGSKTPMEPPLPLGEKGAALWAMAWTEASAWVARSDTWTLALLCQAIDERESLRERVLAEGDRYERYQLRALEKTITDWLQLFGFTPADRTRLGVAEVRVDELEEFRKQA